MGIFEPQRSYKHGSYKKNSVYIMKNRLSYLRGPAEALVTVAPHLVRLALVGGIESGLCPFGFMPRRKSKFSRAENDNGNLTDEINVYVYATCVLIRVSVRPLALDNVTYDYRFLPQTAGRQLTSALLLSEEGLL